MGEPSYRAAPEGATGLRRGWTTGTCATAAATAATSALLGLGWPDPVQVRLPRGGEARLPLAERRVERGCAVAAIRKDAGDDPDVTHGCLVRVTARPLPRGSGVRFRAGDGVGTVTRAGLALAPGEPAINPVPRAMMRDAVAGLAGLVGVAPDVELTVAIPGGAEIALRTLNPRLGITGGLSILGTTGVVVPYSCSSWIHSIHRGIDVARAAGLGHIAASTGSTSERFVRRLYDLPEIALIDMGDFAGGTLRYLRRHPVRRLTLAGGIGKLAKLGQGAADLHSARSRLDRERLAAELAAAGAPERLLARLADTALLAGLLPDTEGFPLGDVIAEKARSAAQSLAGPQVAVETLVVGRDGSLAGRAGGA
jgi:cobalt-precorrin-5B (C1)-methyltransferase